jgi:hypothetical protein
VDKKQFSNTKSIVRVETGIATLISYRHYLKIVGNNKLDVLLDLTTIDPNKDISKTRQVHVK